MDLFTTITDGEPSIDTDPAAEFVDTFYTYYDPRYEIVNVGPLHEEDSFIIDLYTHSPSRSRSRPLSPTPRAFAYHMHRDSNSDSDSAENLILDPGASMSFIDTLVEALAAAEDLDDSDTLDSDVANKAARELKAELNHDIDTAATASATSSESEERERGRRRYRAEKTHESHDKIADAFDSTQSTHDTPPRERLPKEIAYAHS